MTMRTFYVILVSAVCTLTLRALPFVLFRKDKAMPAWLSRLGETLPSAIMAVLVVYCLKDIPAQPIKTGVPQLLGVAIVALTYRWKRNTLLSIALGTVGYRQWCHAGRSLGSAGPADRTRGRWSWRRR